MNGRQAYCDGVVGGGERRVMNDCPNYRCRREIKRPRVLTLAGDRWNSVVCPHCHWVLQLNYIPAPGEAPLAVPN
jgi:hypothetical protein